MTADARSPYATEKPLISSATRWMSADGIRLSPPPAAPGHAKWLPVGSSKPSIRTVVSYAPPPRTSRSFRSSWEGVTPGRNCSTRATSSRPPTAAATCMPVISALPRETLGGLAGGSTADPRTSVVTPRLYSSSTRASTPACTVTVTAADAAKPASAATSW